MGTPVNWFSTSLPIQGFLKENASKLTKAAFYVTNSLYPAGTFGGMEKLTARSRWSKSGNIKLGKIDVKVESFVSTLKK